MTPLSRAAADAGVTYRQADHWCRRSYLRPCYVDSSGAQVDDDGYMVGFYAYLNTREAKVLAHMAPLVRAGIKPDVAAAAARKMVSTGKPEAALCGGVRVTLEPA